MSNHGGFIHNLAEAIHSQLSAEIVVLHDEFVEWAVALLGGQKFLHVLFLLIKWLKSLFQSFPQFVSKVLLVDADDPKSWVDTLEDSRRQHLFFLGCNLLRLHAWVTCNGHYHLHLATIVCEIRGPPEFVVCPILFELWHCFIFSDLYLFHSCWVLLRLLTS